MTAVRFSLLLGAALLLATAGCAQQPQKADNTPPTATPAMASNPAVIPASTQLTSGFPPRLLVFAYEQGWRQVVVEGNNRYFCRTDAPSGSLINGPLCVTLADLETEQVLVQQEQEKMMQPIPYLPMRYP